MLFPPAWCQPLILRSFRLTLIQVTREPSFHTLPLPLFPIVVLGSVPQLPKSPSTPKSRNSEEGEGVAINVEGLEHIHVVSGEIPTSGSLDTPRTQVSVVAMLPWFHPLFKTLLDSISVCYRRSAEWLQWRWRIRPLVKPQKPIL